MEKNGILCWKITVNDGRGRVIAVQHVKVGEGEEVAWKAMIFELRVYQLAKSRGDELREDSLQYLCCPLCYGDFTPNQEKTKEDQVISGFL